MAFDTTDDLVRHINAQHAEVVKITAEEAGKTRGKLAEIEQRMMEAEQALARRPGGDPAAPRSGWIGASVIGSDNYKAFVGEMNLKGRVSLKVENLTTAAGSAGALITPDYRQEVVTLPRVRPFIRSLIAPGKTGADRVIYPRQVRFDNNAAVVTEGALKPQSDVEYEQITANVATIAHWLPASKQAVADAPMLQGLIDSDLRYGLAIAEERQILFGDGVGDNLEGIVTVAEAFAPAFAVTDHQHLDDLLLAIAQVEQAKYPASGLVVNDLDWRAMQAIKDGEGRYIGGGPFGAQLGLAWNVPVVATPTIPQGHFLAGAFGLGAQIFDREEATVMISDEDRDNFVRNMITILAEERLAMAVKRTEAFVYGQYSNVTGV